MDLNSYWGLAGVLIVVALVEVVKRLFQTSLQSGTEPIWFSRIAPLLGILIGVAWNVALGMQLEVPINMSIIMGVVVGLAASGLYSSAKAVADR